MLTKQDQRAIKELVLCFNREKLIGMDWPSVWFIPPSPFVDQDTWKPYGQLAGDLWTKRILPWPDDPCIVVHPSGLEEDHVRQTWGVYRHNASFIARTWCVDMTGTREPRCVIPGVLGDAFKYNDVDFNGDGTTPAVFARQAMMSQVLCMLVPAAMPCGYVVRSRIGGFGPPSIRRVTRDRPIFSVIPYERLYHEVKTAGGEVREVQPHARRGHIRYLWAKAGVSRHRLPSTAAERYQIAAEKKVQMVYVSPTWVGTSRWRSEGCEHEVLTGEVALQTRFLIWNPDANGGNGGMSN